MINISLCCYLLTGNKTVCTGTSKNCHWATTFIFWIGSVSIIIYKKNSNMSRSEGKSVKVAELKQQKLLNFSQAFSGHLVVEGGSC